MIDNNTYKTIAKFKSYGEEYKRYLYREIARLTCEISEIPAPATTPRAAVNLRQKYLRTDGAVSHQVINGAEIFVMPGSAANMR